MSTKSDPRADSIYLYDNLFQFVVWQLHLQVVEHELKIYFYIDCRDIEYSKLIN